MQKRRTMTAKRKKIASTKKPPRRLNKTMRKASKRGALATQASRKRGGMVRARGKRSAPSLTRHLASRKTAQPEVTHLAIVEPVIVDAVMEVAPGVVVEEVFEVEAVIPVELSKPKAKPEDDAAE
jgi:hypothetical protein